MFDTFALRYQKYAPVVLRIGLAVVFFLFGLQKLSNPGQTTAEIQLLLELELADAAAANYYLGIIEMLVAGSFLIGFKVRIFSLIAAILVSLFFASFLLKFGLSINPDIYRDVGLFGGSLALFLLGAGPMSVDSRKNKP